MRRILGAAFALMMAVSLVLLPSPVSAGLGDDCTWDLTELKGIKWMENEQSWNLYLRHWGRTPIQAMTRLAGLSGPNIGTYINCRAIGVNECWPEGCPGCRKNQSGYLAGCDDPVNCDESKAAEACPALMAADPEPDCYDKATYKDASCCCCWGVSLSFANKSWAGCDIGDHPRVNNDHPAHFGNSEGGAANYGGDWGNSGCPHTECITQTWCLQDNLCANPGVNG